MVGQYVLVGTPMRMVLAPWAKATRGMSRPAAPAARSVRRFRSGFASRGSFAIAVFLPWNGAVASSGRPAVVGWMVSVDQVRPGNNKAGHKRRTGVGAGSAKVAGRPSTVSVKLRVVSLMPRLGNFAIFATSRHELTTSQLSDLLGRTTRPRSDPSLQWDASTQQRSPRQRALQVGQGDAAA